MIFVTGFARGGTSWLRDCVAFHPQVVSIPYEMPLFRDLPDRDSILSEIAAAIDSQCLPQSNFYVNKAPANAPFLQKACHLFPEAKFIFIIRDPRDVLVSHQRGNQAWMRGANSAIDGCMKKIQRYYEGYLAAEGSPNLLLVKYEDLHQQFPATLRYIYEFIGLDLDADLVERCFEVNNFVAATGRAHREDQDATSRKGVIGDWAAYLSDSEIE